MPLPHRLSALDAAFLELSTPETPFVPGCVLLLDRPLAREALAARIEALLAELPRYRQRIARAPMLHSLAWVDDERFSLDRHVDVLRVPAPGGLRELETCVAERLTSELPENHPPWRLWTVDGLAEGGALFAIVHHALVDGVAGIGLLERLLSLAPESAAERMRTAMRPRAVEPLRPAPVVERVIQRVAADLRGRAEAWRRLTTDLEPRRLAPALADLLWQGLHAANDLGLDGRAPTRERSFATLTLSLDETKAIKRALGVTVNDVLLAAISGALRRYVTRRSVDPGHLHDVRALVPVNRHARDEHATSGNRVALLLTGLAVDEADPTTRVRRIAQTTRQLKQRDMAGAGDMLVALSDLTWSGVLTNVLRLALGRRAFNTIITNVPGPPVPLYLLDTRVTRFAPIVNLWPHIPIGIAIGSYAGTITITVDADRAVMPDPRPFIEDLGHAFAELRGAVASHAAPVPAP